MGSNCAWSHQTSCHWLMDASGQYLLALSMLWWHRCDNIALHEDSKERDKRGFVTRV